MNFAELDKQHKEMIHMINQLVDCSAAQNAGSSGTFHAVDFLQKPFNEQQLLDSVQKALSRERPQKLPKSIAPTLWARCTHQRLPS